MLDRERVDRCGEVPNKDVCLTSVIIYNEVSQTFPLPCCIAKTEAGEGLGMRYFFE